MDTDKNNDGSVELKGELAAYIMSEGQAKLAKKIEDQAKAKGIPQEIAQQYYDVLSGDPEIVKQVYLGDSEKANARIDEIIMEGIKGQRETVMGIATNEDGTRKIITYGDFLDTIKQGLDEEKPNIKAKEDLQFILGSLLDYAKKQTNLADDPVAAKTLEALRLIYNYLQDTIAQTEELDKFLQGAREFMATPRPAGIENLLKISAGRDTDKNGKRDNGEITLRETEKYKITFEGRLGIDEQKISEMIRLTFAANNPYKAKEGLNTHIMLSVPLIMDILGRADTWENRRKFRKQLDTMLKRIAQQTLTIKNKKDQDRGGMTVGKIWHVDPRQDMAYFEMNEYFAAYLNAGAFSQYSSKTLRLGTQKKPLPFYLAIKLQDHYFHDGNRLRKDSQGEAKPTNNILSIKTLLDFAGDIIPTFEQVQEYDQGHWIRLIRDPLEEALDEIQKAGLFKWDYCRKGGTAASPQEIRGNNYQKWSNLYIIFRLIPEEPDQTERLEHKQQRIEAAKAKQALKDAETIIKADKIQKKANKSNKEEVGK